MQKGRTKPSRLASQNETAASQYFMAKSGGVLQRLQISLHGGVVDPQKLVGRGHHVDMVGLTIGALLVHSQ